MIANCTPIHLSNARFQLVYEPYLGDAVSDLALYQTHYSIVRFHILDDIQQELCRPALA